MKRYLCIAFAIFSSLAFSSCALVFTGLHQRVPIYSNVPQSEVYLNGNYVDTTPCIVKVKRSYDATPLITVSKTGYTSETFRLKRKLNEVVWLNGFLPWNWVADFSTGASIKYRHPDTVLLVEKRKRP